MSKKPLRKTQERQDIPAPALARVIQRKQTALASISRFRKILREKRLDDGTIESVVAPFLAIFDALPIELCADQLRDFAPYANDLLLFNREQLDFTPGRRADIVAVFKELFDVICDSYLAAVGFIALAAYAYPDDKLPPEIGAPIPEIYKKTDEASYRVVRLVEYWISTLDPGEEPSFIEASRQVGSILSAAIGKSSSNTIEEGQLQEEEEQSPPPSPREP